MYEQIGQSKTGPHGELYITLRHLDPGMVRQQFKGMVDRCRDVGFDLVGGLVNVVPTAHYTLGGVRFDPDCRTEMPGLFVAGEDYGGVPGDRKRVVSGKCVYVRGDIGGRRMSKTNKPSS